jgi:hypothetical protein
MSETGERNLLGRLSLRHWDFIRHSSFVISHSAAAFLLALLLFVHTAAAQTGTLTYPLKDNFNLREGTIECWVQFPFNFSDYLPAKEFQTLAVLFDIQAEKGTLMASHFVGAMFGENNGGWFFRPGPKPMLFGMAAPALWKKGEWHHVAFSWKRKMMRGYLDGKEVTYRDQQATLQEMFGSVTDQPLMFGCRWNKAGRFVLDDVRVSAVARGPEELGFAVGELKPDPYTMVLDSFECDFVPDGKLLTKPKVLLNGEGGKVSAGCVFVDGKFGKGLSLYKP